MEDYKEKYKAAIERAKEELGSGCFNKGSIEYIFPELKESAGEKIRKALIDYFEGFQTRAIDENAAYYKDIAIKDILAWLEKVGKNEEIKDGNSIGPHFGKPIITDCGAKEKIQEKIIELSHKEDQVWSEEDEDVIYALETILDILVEPEAGIGLDEVKGVKNVTMRHWLQSLKQRLQ